MIIIQKNLLCFFSTQKASHQQIRGQLLTGILLRLNLLKTCRDDDDINDVASMAGVNLSEESARILATSSELVGMVTRSCKDEAFLSTPSLSRIALEIGERQEVGLKSRPRRILLIFVCLFHPPPPLMQVKSLASASWAPT